MLMADARDTPVECVKVSSLFGGKSEERSAGSYYCCGEGIKVEEAVSGCFR